MSEPIISCVLNSRPQRANILDIGVHALQRKQACDLVVQACLEDKFSGFINVHTTHSSIEAQTNTLFKQALDEAFLITPDGMPLVLCAHSQGLKMAERVYGPNLMLDTIQASKSKPLRHFLWGAGEGVSQELQQKLQKEYPYLEIVGAVTPPFRVLTTEEELELLEQIKSTKPHCFWVGISTPKQDLFMHQFLKKYKQELQFDDQGFVMLGVGAAFDFHSGKIKQAPKWMQRSCLEWLFRLLMEPKRLFKRYLTTIPQFIYLFTKQIILGQNQPLD